MTDEVVAPDTKRPAAASNTATSSSVKVGVAPMPLSDPDFYKATMTQIYIWSSIILAAVLFFTIMALVDMPIQKNSILYAKYGTTKPGMAIQ
jgi:hypothetical protein